MRMLLATGTLLLSLLTAVAAARADEVTFKNGDRLTGTIISAAGGKLVIKTDAAGEVTVDMSKVKTFATAEPVRLRVGEQPPLSSPVSPGAEGEVQAEVTPGSPPEPVPIKSITAINPPLPAWTGSLVLNGAFTTGNSVTQQIGFSFAASKRWEADRLSFGAQYSYGREKDQDTGVSTVNVNYGMLVGKYDHFLTKKLYLYGQAKVERDTVAGLLVRVSPSAGAGYQWFEGPTFNLLTEAGLAWTYEDYEESGSRQFWGPRLAYAVDWTPFEPIKLYHTLEYLPSFSDFTGDYLLNIDAGLRAAIWKALFADFKIEFRYDSTPAPGKKSTDTRYLVGVGWKF
jgi:putative salt-induced outer membrane protein YdiY